MAAGLMRRRQSSRIDRGGEGGGVAAWLHRLLRRLPGAKNRDRQAAMPASSPEVRSRQLLRRTLSPSQLREFEAHGCFTVTSPGRGNFVILPRPTFNVMDLHTGAQYCCVTETAVPLFDLMLVQKLLLEHEPDRFFAAANCRAEVKRPGDNERVEALLARD